MTYIHTYIIVFYSHTCCCSERCIAVGLRSCFNPEVSIVGFLYISDSKYCVSITISKVDICSTLIYHYCGTCIPDVSIPSHVITVNVTIQYTSVLCSPSFTCSNCSQTIWLIRYSSYYSKHKHDHDKIIARVNNIREYLTLYKVDYEVKGIPL